MVDDLVRRLLGPAGPDFGCDTCFDELDRYVDAEVEGRDPAAAVPGMDHHLAGCPACREEYETLVALARGEAQTTRR